MKTYVMIPTYNEKENIQELIKKILALKIKNLHIVVIDDNSPDKTADIVKSIANKKKNVHLLLRKTNKGRGAAGKAGYLFCLQHKADTIIEMDADLSHDPKYIPYLLKKTHAADIVLGSRLVQGGKDIGRSVFRQFITKGANLYIRIMLGLTVKDCNSGYRCFKRNALQKINPNTLESKGPAIVQEVLFKGHLKGLSITEIPITFVDRIHGKSKLGLDELIMGYYMVLKLKTLQILGKM